MRYGWVLGAIILVGGSSACAESGNADLSATQFGSAVFGTATLTDTPKGLRVVVQVAHVPPGTHGLHIHQYGSCGNEGKAAGGHYNPSGVKHGFLPRDGFRGAHAGDLGNIEVGADGTGTLDLTLKDLRLGGGKYSVGGRAIILHEKVDDFSQPLGNAGGRIGCGPIVITGE